MKAGLFLVALSFYIQSILAQASEDTGDIIVPKNSKWLAEVDVSKVPKIEVRPVGSGVCEDAKCDGTDNDKCFESCGNKANPTDIYGCPQAHQWALTFDDGPSNYTGQLLDSLDQLGVKATFCVMGANVKKYPEFLRRAYESGHHIASHTYSHPHLMSLTNEEIINEMKATEEAIRDVIGIRPTYVRPPFGEADDRVKGLMKAMGYKMLLWNVDPTDYDVYTLPDAGKKIQNSFKAAANGIDTGLNAHEEPGFISLQHDLYKESVEQVPKVVQFLKGKGYQFVTAAQCVNDQNPHEQVAAEGRMKSQSNGTAAPEQPNKEGSSSPNLPGVDTTIQQQSNVPQPNDIPPQTAPKEPIGNHKENTLPSSGANTLTAISYLPYAALFASFFYNILN
ncbi:hypothetical protein BJ944DRAFT_182850 [Cunninghamella echinulata]|nr:hypothetical protein BJ944DRAFT_182850 [Cunninghamella echinulata]